VQLAALQQTESHAPLAQLTVHVLAAGPPHVTELVHAFVSHEILASSVRQSTVLRHAPGPHVTWHESLALHWMVLVHAFAPQWTMHALPPQRIELVHAPSAHSMSQLPAPEQSIVLVHPPGPQSTLQMTSGGHVTVDSHFEPLQSMTQLPSTHAPPGHDCGVHGAPLSPGPPGPPTPVDDEPLHATMSATTKSARVMVFIDDSERAPRRRVGQRHRYGRSRSPRGHAAPPRAGQPVFATVHQIVMASLNGVREIGTTVDHQ
jgi:hypothetical protein